MGNLPSSSDVQRLIVSFIPPSDYPSLSAVLKCKLNVKKLKCGYEYPAAIQAVSLSHLKHIELQGDIRDLSALRCVQLNTFKLDFGYTVDVITLQQLNTQELNLDGNILGMFSNPYVNTLRVKVADRSTFVAPNDHVRSIDVTNCEVLAPSLPPSLRKIGLHKFTLWGCEEMSELCVDEVQLTKLQVPDGEIVTFLSRVGSPHCDLYGLGHVIPLPPNITRVCMKVGSVESLNVNINTTADFRANFKAKFSLHPYIEELDLTIPIVDDAVMSVLAQVPVVKLTLRCSQVTLTTDVVCAYLTELEVRCVAKRPLVDTSLHYIRASLRHLWLVNIIPSLSTPPHEIDVTADSRLIELSKLIVDLHETDYAIDWGRFDADLDRVTVYNPLPYKQKRRCVIS